MVAAYSSGIYLATTYITNNYLILHFITSVAISGALAPQMYIHLVEMYAKQEFTPSRALSSIRIASHPETEIEASSFHSDLCCELKYTT